MVTHAHTRVRTHTHTRVHREDKSRWEQRCGRQEKEGKGGQAREERGRERGARHVTWRRGPYQRQWRRLLQPRQGRCLNWHPGGTPPQARGSTTVQSAPCVRSGAPSPVSPAVHIPPLQRHPWGSWQARREGWKKTHIPEGGSWRKGLKGRQTGFKVENGASR